MKRVVIIGAGLVGSAMAVALHRANIPVILLDAFDCPLSYVGETKRNRNYLGDHMPDLRCSALVPGSINFLKHLGVWENVLAKRASVFYHMTFWHDAVKENTVQLNATEAGLNELGFIVENSVLQESLSEIISQEKIEVLRPVKVISIENKPEKVFISYQDSQEKSFLLEADLVIAADGANSWVREHLDFPVEKKSYGQNAIVTYVRHTRTHENTAYQSFLPTGPVGFLPLTEKNTSSIVWSGDTQFSEQLIHDSDEIFNLKLTQYMQHVLGEITVCGKRVMIALQKQHAQEYIKPRVALIGDAAHTIHPLAGQGLNLGFADAQKLAFVIQEAQEKRRDIGALDTLRKFERARKSKNLAMFTVVNFIKQSFSSSSSPSLALLSQGLHILNSTSFLKRRIILQASYP